MVSGAAHTSRGSIDDIVGRPVHFNGSRNTDGDITLTTGDVYISKIQVNGNTAYTAGPTTIIYIVYKQGNTETNLYGPLNIKTVDVSIGVTLHMRTLLGSDLKSVAVNANSVIARVSNCNTNVQIDIWGYTYS